MANEGAILNIVRGAITAQQQGRFADAERLCRRALAREPTSFPALHRLGLIKISQQDYPAAIELLNRAIAINSRNADVYKGLGDAFRRQGELEAACASYRRAIALDPKHADAHCDLGIALALQGEDAEAIQSLQFAAALNPGDARLPFNLGFALAAERRSEPAVEAYRAAVKLDPNYAEAYINLADLLREQGKVGEAIDCLAKALAIKPLPSALMARLIEQLHLLCDWKRASRLLPELKRRLGQTAEMVAPFSLISMPIPPAFHRAAAERFAGQFKARSDLRPAPRGEPHAKLRIGYLSADFSNHATAILLAEVLELHDRGRFEISAFSYGRDDASAMRARLHAACDSFVEIRRMSDARAARCIEGACIDVLVDLQGYTRHGRSQIAALRPAPIQVNWLGYPGTMGAPFIDYIIADKFIVPSGSERFYSEKIVRLPGAYQPNDRKRAIGAAPTRAECGLPPEGTVFCSFNQLHKVGPDHFSTWMRILDAVPNSVLWLLEHHAPVSLSLRREAEARGISGDRLVFATMKPLSQHLARYRIADLMLDTFPCNSHTTASDSLWAGCPLVTLAGESFASRVAGSLLHAVGLPELVTTSLADYERLAVRLGMEACERAAMKAKLAANRDHSALFDTPRFVAHLEAAYERMWAIHAAGEPPRHIDVAESMVPATG